MRQGVVLGPSGGALERMALPYRFFVGGRIGSGHQWVSWIHLDDVVGLFRFVLEHPEASGPINVTAPEPVTNAELARTIGSAMGRPAWMPVPSFALHLAIGELAYALLTGQRVIPSVAERLGYSFAYPTLKPALRGALSSAA
jgi:uncharacterized protein (TIGR01777 family)